MQHQANELLFDRLKRLKLQIQCNNLFVTKFFVTIFLLQSCNKDFKLLFFVTTFLGLSCWYWSFYRMFILCTL
jgi:hypothetical protein